MAEKAAKLSRDERRRVGYYDKKGELLFLLTQKGEDFVLYRKNGPGVSELIRLGKAKTPTVLEEKFKVHEEMRK